MYGVIERGMSSPPIGQIYKAQRRMQLGEGGILQMDNERSDQEILQPPNVRVPTFLIGVGEVVMSAIASLIFHF